MEFPTRFDPKEAEPRLYQRWEDAGLFTARADSPKPAFTIVIPPPNVTGSLHMGHALNNTLQDLLIRWKRMDGCEALWLPGTDHAGIATQNVVEKELRKAGTNRHQLGREAFLKKVWEWKEEYGNRILYQLRRLGSSCDWSRTRFTMDEGYSAAIRTVFVSLFKKGHIYRGLRVINWCPRCQTALSDLEVRRPEGGSAPGKLWHLRYPVKGEPGRHIVVATTRPETMLGDTAVMVHPEDERYRGLVGKTVNLPFVDREIPIISDPYVDRAFGSGAVKVTPAHDANDFEVGRRHKLPAIVVMDETGRMNDKAGPFEGLDRFEARKKVVARLEELALLEKVEDHATPIGMCDRCDTIIEPYLSEQWFVRMKELAAPAIAAVKRREVVFHPDRWAKVYLDWMENIQDWCISRQLWWGHRIPVWYCECGEAVAAVEDPKSCPKCGKRTLEQDEDVLDTWFSSALWPFATLGWPEETEDLEKFYPTDVLVTDRGIINLWVARMIVSGLEFRGERPFADVLINATIMDDAGQRMSKSKGTGIDPLDLLDRYGADALRFALAMIPAETQDFRFGKNLSLQRTEQARNFVTKLWNACRYVASNAEGVPAGGAAEAAAPEDRWILSRLHSTVRAVTGALEAFESGRAAQALYGFVWDDFCDWYIEWTKRRTAEPACKSVLMHVVETTLRLLHPFIPFVTEELWQRFRAAGFGAKGWMKEEWLMTAKWPDVREALIRPELEERMAPVFEAVKAVREVRAHYTIPAATSLSLTVAAGRPEDLGHLREMSESVKFLANLKDFRAEAKLDPPKGTARWTGASVSAFVTIAGLIDREKELARSRKELDTLKAGAERSRKQLANEAFRRAKPDLAAELEAGLAEFQSKISALETHIAELGEMS